MSPLYGLLDSLNLSSNCVRRLFNVGNRVVQRNRLRWFGHVVRMDNDNWVKKFVTLEVNGRRDPGRPKKNWEQVIAC